MASTKKSNTLNTSSPVLKQGTLAFSSAKRTNSNTTAKTKRPPPVRRSSSAIEKEKQRPEDVISEWTNNEEDSNDVLEISSEEEYSPAPVKWSSRAQKSVTSNATKTSTSSSVKRLKDEPPAIKSVDQRSILDVSNKSYRKHYGQVRAKMGNLEPIHAEGQNKIHQILRVFDMSYEYGPCVGMTRLERWERAASFDLHPPEEVRDILLTREGVEKDEYSQCVLYGEV
ncbi:DNA polymerase delta, subunit 4-domain-containing protein [Suillus ampliporus]|nr:DNA polymerase delta, subunit 4-domain-containing protein [Suillus ampliporus]